MTDFSEKNCPGRDVFIRAISEKNGFLRNEGFIDHVRYCPKCRLMFKTMAGISSELDKNERNFKKLLKESLKEIEGKEKRAVQVHSLLPRRKFLRYVPAAAGIVIFLSLFAAYFFLIKPGDDEVLRSRQDEHLQLLEPKGKIKKPPETFKWTAVLNVDIYSFELIDSELHTIIISAAKKNHYKLPEEIAAKLVEGKIYIWKVEAYNDDGKLIDSRQQYFEIIEY